ncbi:protein MEI2-like 6 [Lolium rigidum]|uniref:protein MEI2-like 6 n=1 Tax=Lolium rigidum TaxID=89674 RepID=UPI001F5E32EA|nr:protein MEI2-like 6 [Lolium rigidum]
MAASSTSRLNPAAPSFVSSSTHLCSPPPFGLPMGCLLPPPPPPPCSLVGGIAPMGPSVFPTLPWLHVPAPAQVFCSPPACVVPVCPSTVPAYCTPPPQPPLPARRCTIKEIADDGSDESPKAEMEGEPSPRSVLTAWKPEAAASKRQKPAKVVHPGPKLRAAVPQLPHLPRGVVGSKPAFNPRSGKTSLMICNIPNYFSKRRLMEILDQHCAEENDKLAQRRSRPVLRSEYDFLYLPVDFRTRFNKGYAFVNMTTAPAARRLHAFLHGHSWAAVGSGKVCEVVHAKLQGVDAFAAHFSGSMFPCGDDRKEFLPVRFGPPRDGTRPTAERIIGTAVRPHNLR